MIYVSADTGRYTWEDGDGTQHEFTAASNTTYKDFDDLGLTLTVSSSGYSLTDKYGNQSIFGTSGRLTRQVNNQSTASSITISYQSTTNNLISQIQDGVGRKYVYTYGSDGLLDDISYYGTNNVSDAGRIMSISFDYTNSNLSTITYEDRAISTFSYTTKNLLSTATDADGYKISYTAPQRYCNNQNKLHL